MEKDDTGGAGGSPATADKSRVAPLLKLPTEILTRIAVRLEPHDLFNTRLACKRLESAMFPFFTFLFFRQKQFMLTEESLQALIDISSHPTLGPAIRHLRIGFDNYPDLTPNARFRQRANVLAWKQGAADQNSLICTGRAQMMLVQALRNLPDLWSVGVGVFPGIDGLDPASTRIQTSRHLRSYGLNTIKRKTGERLGSHDEMGFLFKPGFVDTVFCVLLSALAESGVRPAILGGNPEFAQHSAGLSERAFVIPSFLEPAMVPLLAGVKHLYLGPFFVRGPGITEDEIFQNGAGAAPTTDLAFSLLQRFLGLLTNLTHLGLDLRRGSPRSCREQFLRWFSGRNSVEFPSLQVLSLVGGETQPEALYGFCTKFPMLESLELNEICLSTHWTGGSGDIVPGLVWRVFLARFATAVEGPTALLPRLRAFKISNLAAGRDADEVILKRVTDPDTDRFFASWRSGESCSAADFVRGLAKDAVYTGPEEDLESDFFDDYEEDDPDVIWDNGPMWGMYDEEDFTDIDDGEEMTGFTVGILGGSAWW